MQNKTAAIITAVAAAWLATACTNRPQRADDPLADSGRTQRTEHLLENLKALGDSSVYLFGHQDDTVYGIGWESDYSNDSAVHQRSDVESVCNDYPAVLGFDLGGLEQGDERNRHGVPFSRIRQEVIAHYDRGGLVSLVWTDGDADKTEAIARFLQSLETPYGTKVPVVFRLRGLFTADGWRTVVGRLKDSGVTNVLYAYAPATEPDGDEQKYMAQYPGDDYVDLMGLDCYCEAEDADTGRIASFARRLDDDLRMVCALARKHSKAAALTETGYEGIKADNWWTQTLAPVLARHPVSYVLVWRNAHDCQGHYFAPYPGQSSSSDFIRFYNDKRTLFLHDTNGLYLR